jgi:hypothetical protein
LPRPAIAAKIYCFSPPPNHLYKSARSGPPRGAYRDRHGRGSECGGRGSARCAGGIAGRALACERSAARQTNGAEAYGKSVWFWRPWLASSRRRFAKPNRAMQTVNSPAMEARRIRLQGERAISRKTIARGMPECSGCTCMLVCASISTLAHETAGAASTRHSPRPLVWAKRFASPGRNAPREGEGVCGVLEGAIPSTVIVRLVRDCALGRTIQYSRDSSD